MSKEDKCKSNVTEIEVYINIDPNPQNVPQIYVAGMATIITEMRWERASHNISIYDITTQFIPSPIRTEFSGNNTQVSFRYDSTNCTIDHAFVNNDYIIQEIERLLAEYTTQFS